MVPDTISLANKLGSMLCAAESAGGSRRLAALFHRFNTSDSMIDEVESIGVFQ